jgi:hypothetical protein
MSHKAAKHVGRGPSMEGMLRRLASAWAVVAALPLAGCGVFPQPVELRDNGTPTVSLRGLHRFGGGPGGIEVEYQGVRAEGTQVVESFSSVTLGGNTVNGPALMGHRVNMHHAHVVFNRRLFSGSPVQLEWWVGAAAHRLAWSSTSRNPGGTTVSVVRDWVGATGGATGVMVFGPALELHLRYGGAISVDGANGSRSGAELALAWSPVPQLQLRLGYAQNTSNYELSSGDSDLRLRARGPFVGVQLQF